jgi:hypothetical protein
MTYPTWNTPAGSIGSFPSQVALTVQLSATATLPATQIAYAVISGSLPNGISMNSEGLISGVPSIVSSDTNYRFVVRATDDQNGIADRTFSITVSGVASPTFTTPTGTILNTNDSVWIELPIEYTNPVTTNPVNIRVAQGLLPPGLEINSEGVIRGYPEPPILTVNYSAVVTSALSISSNVISVLSTTNFVIDRPVVFSGSVYGGIVAGTTYYVKQIFDSGTFTISETRGGGTLILADGVGDMTVTLPRYK